MPQYRKKASKLYDKLEADQQTQQEMHEERSLSLIMPILWLRHQPQVKINILHL